MNDTHPRQIHQSCPSKLLSYAVAGALALPVGAVMWFETVYLFFGLTGEDPSDSFSFLAATVVFGFAFGWPVFRAYCTARVVQRACQLGLLVSNLLPVVAVAVLLLWQEASNRPDFGMGGLMLYALPYVALGLAVILVIGFGLGIHLAGRRLTTSNYKRSENRHEKPVSRG
ncbi:hypothetical protein [Nitrosomonas marina]|uniref:Uncharacterized protein n=1 Tax=Nitrosomonas marina TaxID=917 RepID=A0A1H8EY22_9PROT|nr:hypothetical protein [Nitrosomonas marina]SEN24501.1 hypothetical protein SAMN05216325_11121 [Nitrosomonas marina]